MTNPSPEKEQDIEPDQVYPDPQPQPDVVPPEPLSPNFPFNPTEQDTGSSSDNADYLEYDKAIPPFDDIINPPNPPDNKGAGF